MLFRQLFEPESCTYTYLLAADGSKQALIIDPVIERLPQYLKLLQELGLSLTYCLDTHVHADHVTASGKLREATACQIVMGDKTKASCVDKHLIDGETLTLDGLSLTALYTPGHTDDSFCYVMSDRVFTGDTLLIRATGRTDFQNGSSEAAYDSLFNKLLRLPEETLVYPAHDYNGMTVSTIGEEKRFNPRLQADSVEAYVEIMNNLKLALPDKIDIAVPANLTCGLQ